MKRIVAVTGSTGRQGGAVVRALIGAEGFEVRALTRRPVRPGQVACDLEDPRPVRAALEGADALFLTTTPYEGGTDAEERQARNAIDAARAAGVGQIVYSSVADARAGTGVAHYDSKGRIEALLDDGGFTAVTILRPTFFMDMVLADSFRRSLARGRIEMAMRPHSRITMIAVDDIAAFAALAFAQPAALHGHVIDLAGDDPDMTDIAAAMADAVGHPVAYRQVPPDRMAGDVRPKATTQRWLEDVGWQIDIAALTMSYPIPLTNLRQWAQRHGAALAGVPER